MRYTINDGYTLDAETSPNVKDETGRILATGLPVVKFKYRPPTHAESLDYRYKWNRAASGVEQAVIDATFIVAHVTDWDVCKDGPPMAELVYAPITKETILAMGEPVVGQIVNLCTVWKPQPQGTQEGN